MAIRNLYSKRNKVPVDVFRYDTLTEKLKIQIVYIWKDFFKQAPETLRKALWEEIYNVICQEHGRKKLVEGQAIGQYSNAYSVELYFEHVTNTDESLDVLEVVFGYILDYSVLQFRFYKFQQQLTYLPEQAVKDLNVRFLENGIGYQFEQGQIIRIDNQLLHKDVILSTLHFLSYVAFKNANDEFLSAHQHFRHQRTKECLNDCLKSLETTLKIICDENNWQYTKTDTAYKLISICINNKLIPDYLQTHFTSLRATLESGVPTLRNRLGGHGQGIDKIEVPSHYAAYMLYLTGTTINFLVSCHNELKLKE